MLSERDIELAHPEAFDFMFGNLPAAKRAEFNRHLGGCRYCQGVVDEYSEIGPIIKSLPPHVEPPPDLEDRTVAAMVAALVEQRAKTGHRSDAEDQAATRAYPIPERQPPSQPETKVQPIPPIQPPAEDETRLGQSPPSQPVPAAPQARPMVTRLPVWRRHRGRLVAVVAAAAAAITGAIAIPLSLLGSGPATVIPLYATTAAKVSGFGAATGRATARQDASGSWNISLTVQHLKSFGDSQWYTCWYVNRNGQVTSAGTFQVKDSGSWTFPMTSAADPHDFSKMEITLGPPSKTGALAAPVILSGRTLKSITRS
jgi:anti-sigma-K factor RskA